MPLARQRGNPPEQRNVAGNCCAGIGNSLLLQFAFLYLEIMRQHGRVAGQASDAAVGVLKYDDVKLSTASRSLSSNLTDSPE